MSAFDPLPIEDALPELMAALDVSNAAVLVAPPGAGKTTRVPLALMDAGWRGDGRLIVLEPRRLAARGAAERMASSLGQRLGQTVGLRARMDVAVSARTRIEVVTQGVFTRMILDDPELTGVAAVLFDEFHERSLDNDLGLALARDAQGLRDDLRLLVMSATLDAAAVSTLLDDAPVVESLGRMFPVETYYLGRPKRERGERLETSLAKAVRRALRDGDGDVLAFLPGQAEIHRALAALEEDAPGDVELLALHGGLPKREQDRVLRAGEARRVILATAIAETSLTLPRVRAVVDGGLARGPAFDPASGLTRLETRRVSRASADQRRGRAGRTAPGRCYRLWDEPETRALVPFDPPEILAADLAPLALVLAEWGVEDAGQLVWLDPPPAGALIAARGLLARIGALKNGSVTPHGRRLVDLPLPPRLGHMLLRAPGPAKETAARLAALLTERGLGGASPDAGARLDALARDRSPRARQAKSLAARWAALAKGEGGEGDGSPAALLALAFPERLALRRAKADGDRVEFLLASGRGAFVDGASSLARADALAVAELTGGAASSRIALAAPLSVDALRRLAPPETRIDVAWDEGAEAVRARRVTATGALVFDASPAPLPHGAAAPVLLGVLRERGLHALDWGGAEGRRARLIFLRERLPEETREAWPDLTEAGLVDPDWLAPFLADAATLADVTKALGPALEARLTYEQTRELDRLAPARLSLGGSSVAVDYTDEGPAVSARAQDFYGLDAHPALLGEPVRVTLLSPARRPVQTTRDLPGFWRGAWRDVRSDMKGRYPKHDWPEEPWCAPPGGARRPKR